MCGRYASFRDAQDLADEFAIADVADDARLLPPSWNLAPTDPVRIVVERAAKDTGEVRRSLRVARWGLVPSWSGPEGRRAHDQRARGVDPRQAGVRQAVRRAALPGPGGRVLRVARPARRRVAGRVRGRVAAPGKVPKQPYWIAPSGGESAAFAGLYEFWRDRTKADDDPDRWLVSTTIVTTDAAPYLAEIHDRMPLVLPADAWDAWLDPAVDARGAADLLGLGGPHDDVPWSRARSRPWSTP